MDKGLTEKSNNKTGKSLLQFIKFGLVGVMNTLVDFLVYTVLVLIFSISKEQTFVDGLFTLIAYACGVLNSFLLNSRWTFKDEYGKTAKEFLCFILVNLVTWGLSFAFKRVFFLYIFEGGSITLKIAELIGYTKPEEIVNLANVLSKLLSVPITIIINFIGNKLFVFRGKAKDTQSE